MPTKTQYVTFRKHIEPDPALTRRFQTVTVDEPDEDKAVLMCRGVAGVLEKIVTNVEKVAKLVGEVSAASQEQAQGIEQANAANDRSVLGPTPAAFERLRAYPWPDLCELDPSTSPSEDNPSCGLTSPLPRLRVEIADTGIGIAADSQEKIFNRFFRAHRERPRDVRGTGLGLGIARNIARAHGGDLSLENHPEGGLAAVLTLPR